MKVKYEGGKQRQVVGPDGALLEVGDAFDADEAWLARHRALLNAGELVEVKAAPKKKTSKKKGGD